MPAATPDLVKRYGKTKVTKSPYFDQIIERYELLGMTMSQREFYDKEVKRIDPEIGLHTWQIFMRRFNKNVEAKRSSALAELENKKINYLDLQDETFADLSRITHAGIRQILEHPELLNNVKVEDRINWFVKIARATDSRARTKMMARDDARKQSILDSMMNESRYGDSLEVDGDYSVDDLEEADAIEVEEEAEEKTRAFDPNDL